MLEVCICSSENSTSCPTSAYWRLSSASALSSSGSSVSSCTMFSEGLAPFAVLPHDVATSLSKSHTAGCMYVLRKRHCTLSNRDMRMHSSW